ncbi:MAG: InlB B-repeat-containing protein [Bacteroidales bacterium]|nr:InlB B-repeat-containing protein [Bacteroidales bacterium]
MKTVSTFKNTLSRTVMTVFMILAMTLTASATDFITDVMVAGHKNQSDFNTLIENLQQQGWTDINQDLNQGCGSGSYYIHLLYKKQSSSGNSGTPITGFYIRTGANPPDNLTHDGRTYYLVPCQGNDSFVNGHGDLNAGCGSGSAYIFLYYTKDVLSNNTGVTDITFNTTQSGAVGENGGSTGYDLNTGCGSNSAYIYMHLTTASGANVVTLCSGSGNVQLLHGHILTGTGGANTHVTIADGATVTLSGVNITSIANNESHQWPGISCLGDAVIVLGENTTNSVKGGYRSSGIHVAEYKTLTLQGSGTLNATGAQYAAGIGSYNLSSCGNITINGGTVNATGGQYAAGIGSGSDNCSCGSISIRGGTVNATGGDGAAGIGSGNNHSDCWHISIYNTVTRVTATKGTGCDNAIGAGGNGSTCQSVTIGDVETGFITQSPFVTFPYTVAFNANGGTGSMANQNFMYNVGQVLFGSIFTRTYYAFEGWATTADGPKVYNDEQSVINLTQTPNATVTLYAKWLFVGSIPGEIVLHDGDTLTGIGGAHTHVFIADGATVTFSGVDITSILEDDNHQWPGITCLGDAIIVLGENTNNNVKGGYRSSGIHVAEYKTLTLQGSGTLNVTGGWAAAGIGGSYESPCGNITISGGTITANGGENAVGIGCGRNSSCGDITINGGSVTATGGGNSAGIGSRGGLSCGNIAISGGTVTATGGDYGAGIGSGMASSCDNIAISGGTVTATGGDRGAGIGSGRASSCGNITISGGTITATGGDRGAGIGSGWPSSCDNIAISGGTITATGGNRGAGIGSGWTSSCDNIAISGGTVTATGGQSAAGIGSGLNSSCGDIIITNGVTRVIATAGQDCNNAIGAGNSDSTCGTVTIGEVETAFITQSPFVTFPYTVGFNANSGTGTMDNQSFMYNVAQHLTANSFTYSGHAFQGWANNAEGPKVYDNEESVSNLADTIATVTLYAKWEALPSTTLPIAGYGTDNGGWHLIASPMSSPITPTAENGLLTNAYDLYHFNQGAEREWENWKQAGDHYHFNLESGCGYLYATQAGTTLTFSGTPYTGNGEVTLHKTTGAQFEGWNLIGNPYGTSATINKAFYRMNPETNAEIIPADNSTVAAMEGIFVVADTDGETVTFAESMRGGESEKRIIINLSDNTALIDRAIIRFDEGQTLPKFQLFENNTKIYIPQNGTDYAMMTAKQEGELPINFKAKENGVYTLTVSETFRFPLSVLRLIDHLTGADIDLLTTPNYTFEAKTTDHANRFKLVFMENEDNQKQQ